MLSISMICTFDRKWWTGTMCMQRTVKELSTSLSSWLGSRDELMEVQLLLSDHPALLPLSPSQQPLLHQSLPLQRLSLNTSAVLRTDLHRVPSTVTFCLQFTWFFFPLLKTSGEQCRHELLHVPVLSSGWVLIVGDCWRKILAWFSGQIG